MKSLFSCIPRKKNKSKKSAIQIEKENVITNYKPTEANNGSVECAIEKIEKSSSEHLNHVENKLDLITETITEEKAIPNQISITETKDKEARDRETEKEKQLYIRLNNAISRIENVTNLLDNKYLGYCLPEVIDQFDQLYLKELHCYLNESQHSTVAVSSQSVLVAQLFVCQRSILFMIEQQIFSDLNSVIGQFRDAVRGINELGLEEGHLGELTRLVADSVLILGWVCLLERPALFVQRNLDGYLINISRLLNDHRFAHHFNWLKSWAVVLKRFSAIITHNFRAALMWGLEGPVPLAMLQCMVDSNYSTLASCQPSTTATRTAKDKVIKTTHVDDMSCQAMTNLMDDLRSGRCKSRLRPTITTNIDTAAAAATTTTTDTVAPLMECPTAIVENGTEQQSTGDNADCVKRIDYRLDANTWIIENMVDESDVEVPQKGTGNCVLIRNCHNCSIQIEGILGSIKLDQSTAINLIIDDVIGPFEVLQCSSIESQVFGKVGKVHLDNVSKFKLFVPLPGASEVEVISSRSSEVELFVSKSVEGGLELVDYDQYFIMSSCRSKLCGGGGPQLSNELF